MAAGWYYQQDGREVGPLSSAELRSMAEAGDLRPWTPLCREQDGRRSAWARAAEVNGLFHDAGDLMGGPICGHCGRGLVDGVCRHCEPAASPPTPPPPVAPQRYSLGATAAPDPRAATPWEQLLRILALFEIGFGWFKSTSLFLATNGMAGRFDDDVAIGSVANSLEMLLAAVSCVPHLLLGLAVFVYVELRRIRRMMID